MSHISYQLRVRVLSGGLKAEAAGQRAHELEIVGGVFAIPIHLSPEMD